MMNLDGMANLLALDADIGNGKKLFGSLISSGSLVIIGVIAGLAVVAAIILFLRKKKKKNHKENENK